MLVKYDKAMEMQKRYLSTYKMLYGVILVFRRLLLLKARSTVSPTMEAESVPAETKKLGYQMCRDSLGGVWSEISEEQLDITKLSGGLTNLLYICSLPPHVDVPDNQPNRVLLRVYGDVVKSCNFVVQNSVVFALMSEKRLGPKLYGMTPEARIEEFVPAKCLQTTDLHIPRFSRLIAEKLAKFHALDMPLCKEPKFLYETMDQWMERVSEVLRESHFGEDRYFMQKFRGYHLEEELCTLKEILSQVKSPVVFSHNDLQEGNILLNDKCTDLSKMLTVIDWEYCSYNYRGYDFGNHFLEWCYNYQVSEYPYFTYTDSYYPTKEQQYTFFRAYLQASGCDINDEVLREMYTEANTFALASHFLWGLWAILQRKMDIQFGFLEYAESRFSGYFEMKQRLPDLVDKV